MLKKGLLFSKKAHFRDEGHDLTFKSGLSGAKGGRSPSKTPREVSNVGREGVKAGHEGVKAGHFGAKTSPFPSKQYGASSKAPVEGDRKGLFGDQIVHLVLRNVQNGHRLDLFVF
jgi:hypothetical protein